MHGSTSGWEIHIILLTSTRKKKSFTENLNKIFLMTII